MRGGGREDSRVRNERGPGVLFDLRDSGGHGLSLVGRRGAVLLRHGFKLGGDPVGLGLQILPGGLLPLAGQRSDEEG